MTRAVILKTCQAIRIIQQEDFYMSLRCAGLTFIKQKRLVNQPFFVINK